MSRQTLEIVQHLKGGHLEAAIGHELDGHVEAVGMADEIAAGEHDRPEARGFHGAQFFFEGTRKRVRVHREALQFENRFGHGQAPHLFDYRTYVRLTNSLLNP